MAVTVQWADVADAARVVDALLVAAGVETRAGRPLLARRYTGLADDLGDAIDAGVPVPSGWRPPPRHLRTVQEGHQ